MNLISDQIQMVLDCEARQSKLTDWETNFIDSVGNQLADDMKLSPKQDNLLEQIWEKVTKI